MFEIEKTFHFEAGHVLKYHDGKCREPHGHSYLLKIKIRSETLIPSGPKTHMVIDFYDIAQVVKPMIDEYFDHRWLNDTLKTDSPTSEFMSKWIYDYLKPQLPSLYEIILYETPTSRVSYSEF